MRASSFYPGDLCSGSKSSGSTDLYVLFLQYHLFLCTQQSKFYDYTIKNIEKKIIIPTALFSGTQEQ